MKITIEKIEKGQKLHHDIIKKASENSDFKERLILNPVPALKEILGLGFEPFSNHKIVVEDQSSDSTIYLNIPKKLNLDSLELTENQLEEVTGGDNPFFDLGYAFVDFHIDLIQWVGDQFTRK